MDLFSAQIKTKRIDIVKRKTWIAAPATAGILTGYLFASACGNKDEPNAECDRRGDADKECARTIPDHTKITRAEPKKAVEGSSHEQAELQIPKLRAIRL